MERERIVAGIRNTEVLHDPMAMMHVDSGWECMDGGAKLIFSRNALPEGKELAALTVSGHPEERDRVIGEFIDVLGVPTGEDRNIAYDYTECVGWVVESEKLN